MHTDQITYLSMINTHHSLRKASDALFISPQALNQSLKSLEDELGIKLVIANKRGTLLTAAGHSLLESGERFLNAIHALQDTQATADYLLLRHAIMDIYSVYGMSNTLLPKLLSHFYTYFPEIDLSLVDHFSPYELLHGMSASELPCEICFLTLFQYGGGVLPEINSFPNLAFQPLLTSAYSVSAAKDHEIYHYNKISIKTVLNYDILLLKNTSDLILPLLTYYGQPHHLHFVNDFNVFRAVLDENPDYLTFNRMTQSYSAMLNDDKRKTIVLSEPITTTFGYVKRCNHQFSPLIMEFLDFTKKYFRNRYGSNI